MTIKLGNLADWHVLTGGALIFCSPAYDAEKARRVRLDLNCEYARNFYIAAMSGGAPRFLAAAPQGLSTIEFVCDGDFQIAADKSEGEIHYWTSEAEEYWTEGDGETFSTIYERQPRNEALEWVMFQAAQNDLRRQKAHDAELAAFRAEIGAIKNDRQSGIHGGPPAEHKEPAAKQPAGKKSGKAAAGAEPQSAGRSDGSSGEPPAGQSDGSGGGDGTSQGGAAE